MNSMKSRTFYYDFDRENEIGVILYHIDLHRRTYTMSLSKFATSHCEIIEGTSDYNDIEILMKESLCTLNDLSNKHFLDCIYIDREE